MWPQLENTMLTVFNNRHSLIRIQFPTFNAEHHKQAFMRDTKKIDFLPRGDQREPKDEKKKRKG